MMRVLLAVSVLALVACTATTSGPSAPEGESSAPAPVASTYPVQYPVIAEAELERRTQAAKARTPDWDITLDPLGFLSSAHLRKPAVELEARRAQEAEFLEKNRELLALHAPNVEKRYDAQHGALYQQRGEAGPIGHVSISRTKRSSSISGHLWPVLPPPGAARPAAELEAMVKKLDPTPDLVVQHGYSRTAASDGGPLALRETFCGYVQTDDIAGPGERPRRPCVDARTGEDVTALLATTVVATNNGRIVRRTVVRGFVDPGTRSIWQSEKGETKSERTY